MAYIGAPLVSTNFVLDPFVATAGQTVFALTQAPASAQSVLFMIDGVVQEPGSAYTVSGTTLTTTSGVPLGSRCYAIHLGVRGTVQVPADGSVTAAKLDVSSVASSLLVAGTVQATTSGTSIDFTNIPSWAKRIVINFSGVSTSGTDNVVVQLGDSGGVETSGYLSTGFTIGDAASPTGANYTNGFNVRTASAANILHGVIELSLLDATTFTWCAKGSLATSAAAAMFITAGSKTLSAALDRVRITTTNGLNTFDAGKVNILYE